MQSVSLDCGLGVNRQKQISTSFTDFRNENGCDALRICSVSLFLSLSFILSQCLSLTVYTKHWIMCAFVFWRVALCIRFALDPSVPDVAFENMLF